MYDVSTLKSDLEGILHGTTLNQITNLDGLINRAARQILLDVDPQETKRLVEIGTPVFDNVWDYPIPSDLKGNKVIDIRPQVNRTPGDIFLQQYNQAFDATKQWAGWNNDSFTIQFNSSIKTIRINGTGLPAGTIVNQIASLNDNGTWSVGDGATNLRVDNQNYVNGGGSLTVDLQAGFASGFIETTDQQAQNLFNQLNQGTEFLYSYLPTASSVTSINLRWGSSAADYYDFTVTVQQMNTVFENGWNFLSFPWKTASVTGAPDASSITYLRITWNYDSTLQTGVKANYLASRMGLFLEMEYYSKFLFRDSATGAYQETVTADTNLINLDTESFNLLTYQVAYLAAQQQQGANALRNDSPMFLGLYRESLDRYKAMYKSELQKPHQTYYPMPNPSYSRYLGARRYWG